VASPDEHFSDPSDWHRDCRALLSCAARFGTVAVSSGFGF